jgi:DNA mismatch endonuclease (patch repair protein)
MSAQRRRDTVPEMQLRSELWRRGYRFRVDFKVVGRRRADVAFTRSRVAVFVDGCFWHCCPLHGSMPKSNAEWWANKLAGNVSRDRASDDELRSAGWRVVRVWEHEAPTTAADRVAAELTA